MNDKTKGRCRLLCGSINADLVPVDENLFYKGVDKSIVHGARLHQTHQAEQGDAIHPSKDDDPGHPPYPFDSGNSLLAITRKHNVRAEGDLMHSTH